MILIDANLLLYAYDSSSAHHRVARRWIEDRLGGPEPVGFAWPAILAFMRISTNPRALSRPLSAAQALEAVSSWLEQPAVTILKPTDRHWEILRKLVLDGQARGPLVMDADLAALAIEHGVTLCTSDRDFTRFPGLHTLNPLISND
ncbi:MAG: TA system VapC family ribonuclease toxin [Terriglobia bacterium]